MSTSINTLIPPLAIIGRLRSPQEETVPKLPPATLCEPCKVLFREACVFHTYYTSDVDFVHHGDADSFQEALELPCDVCVRLYKAFDKHSKYLVFTKPKSSRANLLSGTTTSKGPYRVGPTRYRRNGRTGLRIDLLFESNSCYAYPNAEPYDCKRGNLLNYRSCYI